MQVAKHSNHTLEDRYWFRTARSFPSLSPSNSVVSSSRQQFILVSSYCRQTLQAKERSQRRRRQRAKRATAICRLSYVVSAPLSYVQFAVNEDDDADAKIARFRRGADDSRHRQSLGGATDLEELCCADSRKVQSATKPQFRL